MLRCSSGLLVLALALPGLARDDQPKAQKPSTPAEQYLALTKQIEAAQQEFQKAYGEAKTQEERQKIIQEKYPEPDKFANKFIALAEKYPQDPAAVDAWVWILKNRAGGSKGGGAHEKAIKALMTNHLQDPKLKDVCMTLSYAYDQGSEDLLRAILTQSPSREAKGQACLALAKLLKQLRQVTTYKDNPARLKMAENAFGKARVEALIKADPEKLSKESEALLERVVKDYADIASPFRGTLGKIAESELYEARFLAVGKAAPDIQGSDIDEKPFKLSDFKGKVVMLDFWGNWCGPCRGLYPHNKALMKRLDGKAFVLLGINSDADRGLTRKTMEKENITWRYWWDGGSTNGPIASKWNIQGWPTLYLIDHQGVIRHKFVGSPGDEVIDKNIDEMLKTAEESTKISANVK